MDDQSIPSVLSSVIKGSGRTVALLDHRAGGISTIDYATLGSHIDRLAIDLMGTGARCGDNIALIGRNSSEWIVAFLAVQRIGATAVPHANDLTVEELRGLLKAVPCGLLLAPESDTRLGDLKYPDADVEGGT